MKEILESRDSNQMGHLMKIEWWWDTWINTPLGLYLRQKEHEFIQRSIKSGNSKKHVLDVGGGSGRFAIPLYRQGYELTVVELDKTPLSLLKDKEKNIKCVQGDAKALPFIIRSFDCIIAIGLFSYFKTKAERLSVLSECNTVLRSAGFLLFTTINTLSYKNVMKKMIRSKRDYTPSVHKQSYRQTIEELNQTGFSVKKAHGYHWLPFSRNSLASKFWIDFFAFWENKLNLENLPYIGHYNFFVAQKTK